jgi:hypothetical protein
MLTIPPQRVAFPPVFIDTPNRPVKESSAQRVERHASRDNYWFPGCSKQAPDLARPLAADLRHTWERPTPPGRLTPARVRRGFRNIRAKTA